MCSVIEPNRALRLLETAEPHNPYIVLTFIHNHDNSLCCINFTPFDAFMLWRTKISKDHNLHSTNCAICFRENHFSCMYYRVFFDTQTVDISSTGYCMSLHCQTCAYANDMAEFLLSIFKVYLRFLSGFSANLRNKYIGPSFKQSITHQPREISEPGRYN